MYEIEYYEDESSTPYLKINSNHLPRSDDDVTINEKHYKVYSVKHILNTGPLVEKFIVTVHKKKMRF
jgi:hypothetical protein